MRFTWEPNLPAGGCHIAAHPDVYDGHPTPEVFTMDYTPRFVSPGRFALAAVLAFRPFISGRITFPEAIAPEVARGITTFLEPTTTFPEPVEFAPKALPLGSGVLVVAQQGETAPPVGERAGSATSYMRLLSTATTFGAHVTSDDLGIPTNAIALEPASGDSFDRLVPHLAAAVLVAEDYGVGAIELHATAEAATRISALRDMFSGAGLSLALRQGEPPSGC